MNKWLVTLVIHTQQLSLIEWIICWYQKFALQSSTISLFFKNYSIVDVTTYISDLFIRFNKTKFFPRSQRILIETDSKICIYFLYMYIHKDCPIQNFVWNVQGVEGILFCKKTLKCLHLSLYSCQFLTKWSFTLWYSTKLCYTTDWNFQGQKLRPIKIPHDFFSITPGNSTFFNQWPLEFPPSIFFQYSWEFMSLTLPVCS